MSKLFKSEYMLLIFLIVNMTAENIIFASISKTIFYCVLAEYKDNKRRIQSLPIHAIMDFNLYSLST